MVWRQLCLVILIAGVSQSMFAAPLTADSDIHCSSCSQWNVLQAPYRIHRNTYYVGVAGLSSILITSKQGHILLDGALPQSAKLIEQNIRHLGFRLEDVRYIVNSHAHFDHAGGIAALQRASSAIVKVSPASVSTLQTGELALGDPQYGFGKKETSFPAVKKVHSIVDGETLRLGDIAITAHFTPGHTPGGTTWTWQSCGKDACMNIVYADSLNAVSSDDYRFSDHPDVVQSLRRSISTVEQLPCDILLPVHPEFAGLQAKHARMIVTKENPFIDDQACKQYAAAATKRLSDRLLKEQQ
jgi:metallo-beta-lactamase class B